MDIYVRAKNLSKAFGSVNAVAGLDLIVRGGEIFGLVGPDGAGKTTTIRLLCGLLRPNSGEVEVCGVNMQDHPDKARAWIGYLSQQFSLYEELTALENLRFFAEARGISRHDWQTRSLEILDFVGLAEFSQRRAGQLSGGMKQKLGLATALVHQPKVLLLDEPTSGVDPVTRQDFWRLIIRLVAQDRVAVVVSTPYMDEAARCTHVGFLRTGQLAVTGQPAALRAQLSGRVLALRGEPMNLLAKLAEEDPETEAVHLFGDKYHLRVHSGAHGRVSSRLKRQIASEGGAISQLGLINPQLEDVFIALMENEV